ncbi:lanthionine synthetase C family protein [Streptomyces sp. H10-C2]|uniref:lanthionine synthetase C family protein n=1 Tax=unclassified Streptomyces TaxID=2593676 RepID=UPI0024B9388D|nr:MULTISPECIES: lanthionine synthetase C family protein [unclassified Streptomyces]MDJ0345150.1 lanthionine synthetase C family protein [Streptomyces sp. PH10-H1]MDJ0374118.1 lanthionine synthetase C family protein [Streptomyces sp. H10-C2]
MPNAQWSALLPENTAAAVLDRVAGMAGRARSVPDAVRHDLAHGGAGLALAYHQLDRCLPGEGWDAMADGYIAAVAKGAERAGRLSPGLFGGLAGPAFAAWSVSRADDLLSRWDADIVGEATANARALGGAAHGGPVRVFDVISGMTGTGAYLLCRSAEPACREVLREVLTALVALCGERAGTPNWYTPVEAIKDAELREQFPLGALNCGLSHGIPGPVALLALAMDVGIHVPGQREAIERVVGWLLAHRADDAWCPSWPRLVALPDRPGTAGADGPAARSSWCYGSPGVARALWLAGVAVDDSSLRDLAVETLKAVYRRPASRRGIDATPGLCHGVAGLLQITVRFARDTGDGAFSDAAAELTARLMGLREVRAGAGPGFLDGSAGVVLALLAAATDVPPAWDRALLLA